MLGKLLGFGRMQKQIICFFKKGNYFLKKLIFFFKFSISF